MELIQHFIDLVMHLDKHLGNVMQNYGNLTYLILFLIIFCETGLVVTPFLPGDSLLFATGALAASTGALNVFLVFLILSTAAVLGDTVNYWIGFLVGPKVFQYESTRFLKKEHLERTHKFYEKYGAKTIILARFVPIVRTFAPFVAGVGTMSYLTFITFNVVGGVTWIALFTFGGFKFGNLPVVKENFTFVIIAIIFMSLMPVLYEVWKHRRETAPSK